MRYRIETTCVGLHADGDTHVQTVGAPVREARLDADTPTKEQPVACCRERHLEDDALSVVLEGSGREAIPTRPRVKERMLQGAA